jgi:hypothetical protein
MLTNVFSSGDTVQVREICYLFTLEKEAKFGHRDEILLCVENDIKLSIFDYEYIGTIFVHPIHGPVWMWFGDQPSYLCLLKNKSCT